MAIKMALDSGGEEDRDLELVRRLKATGKALTKERAPLNDPELYLDQAQVPREGYGATILKNLVNAAMEIQPDNSIDIGGGRRFDPTGAFSAASLKNKFPTSRLGRLIENQVKPWEMSPEDWVKFQRDKLHPKINQPTLEDMRDTPYLVDREGWGIDSISRNSPDYETYKSTTGAFAIDKAGTEDPKKIIERLSRERGIETPDYGIAYLDDAPFYGAYSPDANKILLNRSPFEEIHGLANQENLLASTAAHELEHATDFQKGKIRIPTFFEDYLLSLDPKYAAPDVAVPELRSWGLDELPRGPRMWQNLTPERKEFLKAYGKPVEGYMIPGAQKKKASGQARFTPQKSQYNLQGLRELNPWAYERLGSLGHFADVGNFETDWALREIARKAIKEGLEVNPRTMEVFPELYGVKPERPMSGWRGQSYSVGSSLPSRVKIK